MKPNFQKLSINSPVSSFADFWVSANRFGVHWHYHPEIEICYVKNGEGQRMVGDNVSQFKKNDLVLVGSNLPHTWITSDIFNGQNERIEVFVVQFNIDYLININNKAFSHIQNLMAESKRGIDFSSCAKSRELLLKLDKATSDYEKVMALIKLLTQMAVSKEKDFLATPYYSLDYNHKSEIQLSKVCHYIHDNYREQLNINDLADLVSMNTTSFCRFFKRNTGKTCVNYINDLRINHAAGLLLQSNFKIYEVAFDCGFQSLTHFNRTFKKTMGTTPLLYQNLYFNQNAKTND